VFDAPPPEVAAPERLELPLRDLHPEGGADRGADPLGVELPQVGGEPPRPEEQPLDGRRIPPRALAEAAEEERVVVEGEDVPEIEDDGADHSSRDLFAAGRSAIRCPYSLSVGKESRRWSAPAQAATEPTTTSAAVKLWPATNSRPRR